MKQLIRTLTETFSPSGYEHAIRNTIQELIKPYVDEIKVDAMGNLITRKGEKRNKGKRIMIAAHMDEIGLMASHVDENGFIRFTGLGSLHPQILFGGRVRFMNDVHGIIGREPITDTPQRQGVNHLFIDVGVKKKKDCPVNAGDVAAFDRPFVDLGNRLVAKAMDNRVGCAIMIEAMKRIKKSDHEIYFVFTTQEEVGQRGAVASAFGIDPEIGISLDVTLTGDTPKARKLAVNLGDGPAIKIKGGRMISDIRIVNWMFRIAEENQIPYQREILEGGNTDAKAIQVSRSGVPIGCISIPCRYVHSPSEMIDINDVENSTKLLVSLLEDSIDLK